MSTDFSCRTDIDSVAFGMDVTIYLRKSLDIGGQMCFNGGNR
jgi:hypothetical protein